MFCHKPSNETKLAEINACEARGGETRIAYALSGLLGKQSISCSIKLTFRPLCHSRQKGCGVPKHIILELAFGLMPGVGKTRIKTDQCFPQAKDRSYHLLRAGFMQRDCVYNPNDIFELWFSLATHDCGNCVLPIIPNKFWDVVFLVKSFFFRSLNFISNRPDLAAGLIKYGSNAVNSPTQSALVRTDHQRCCVIALLTQNVNRHKDSDKGKYRLGPVGYLSLSIAQRASSLVQGLGKAGKK